MQVDHKLNLSSNIVDFFANYGSCFILVQMKITRFNQGVQLIVTVSDKLVKRKSSGGWRPTVAHFFFFLSKCVWHNCCVITSGSLAKMLDWKVRSEPESSPLCVIVWLEYKEYIMWNSVEAVDNWLSELMMPWYSSWPKCSLQRTG